MTNPFPVLAHGIFFNHAGVAPLPAPAAEAIKAYADDFARRGAAAWPEWAKRLGACRESARHLLGAEPDEIGLIHNTTHGILCIANSLAWRPGDNVVGIAHDFPANYYPWKNLESRGVALRTVPEQGDHTFALDDFAAAIDRRTRLVAVSLVNYATGLRLPIEQIAQLCRDRSVLLCVDGIQAIGALPTRVADLGCDFMVADSHKWMLGPEGIGIIYVRRDRLELLNDSMTGWIGRDRYWEFDNQSLPLPQSARRFEEGSFNLAGAAGMAESLALINAVGIDEIWRRIETLTAHLAESLAGAGFEIVSPRADGRRSGILIVRRDGLDPDLVTRRLAAENITVVPRRGGIRISPHFYNTAGQVEDFTAALTRAARGD